jgi:molybdopterin-guanine dinucleotide biosynthesis protein A
MQFTAIILAGGQSSRMGSNKALIQYDGKSLIQYSIDLATLFTREILISTNNNDLDNLGFPVIKDAFPLQAPLAGIHAGLRASHTDWNLVLTCDMPNVSKRLIEQLILSLEEPRMMVVLTHDGYIEPLCGFYHRDLIPLLERNMQAGKLSLLDIPGEVSHKLVSLEDLTDKEIANLFRNMNSRKDLLY